MGAPQLGSCQFLCVDQVHLLICAPLSCTGTWQSHANLPHSSLIPLPSDTHLHLRQAATLAINPPTAWRMLSDFVPLNPEDPNCVSKGKKKQWVIQNGANSAVGQAVIQLAREWGVGTINLVRSRSVPNLPNAIHLEKSSRQRVLMASLFGQNRTAGHRSTSSSRTCTRSVPTTSLRTMSSFRARTTRGPRSRSGSVGTERCDSR